MTRMIPIIPTKANTPIPSIFHVYEPEDELALDSELSDGFELADGEVALGSALCVPYPSADPDPVGSADEPDVDPPVVCVDLFSSSVLDEVLEETEVALVVLPA